MNITQVISKTRRETVCESRNRATLRRSAGKKQPNDCKKTNELGGGHPQRAVEGIGPSHWITFRTDGADWEIVTRGQPEGLLTFYNMKSVMVGFLNLQIVALYIILWRRRLKLQRPSTCSCCLLNDLQRSNVRYIKYVL